MENPNIIKKNVKYTTILGPSDRIYASFIDLIDLLKKIVCE